MKAEIKKVGGALRLLVNGEIIPTDAYITYFTDRACYGDFSEAGYRLFSVPIFCSSKTINEVSQSPCFTAPIFDTDTPRYNILDDEILRIVRECPDALILPRVNLSVSDMWEKSNPDELCYDGTNGYLPRYCFSSDAWLCEVKRMLGLIIDHVNSSDYRDNIIGYQLAAGTTEEWFSFDKKGSQGKRSEEEYQRRCKTRGDIPTESGYYQFLSDIVAERICTLSSFTKQKGGKDIIVGGFYGYTLECPFRESCHNSLDKLLECPDIDFICSPVSYAHGREMGRDHGCMLPFSSLELHGKLYFAENDTRTHLTRPPYADIPYFQNPVFGPRTLDDTLEMLKMHYSKALINRYGHWWFDMWGGWYASAQYMDLMKRFLEISKGDIENSREISRQIALFVDEKAIPYVDDSNVGNRIIYEAREVLGLIGAPYDIYLASDYSAVSNKYTARVLLKVVDTETTVKIEEDSDTLVVTDTIKRDELMMYLCDRGVHLYSEREMVIYASDEYIFVHTAYDGEQRIDLPYEARLYELFEDKYYPTSFHSNKGKSYLFRIDH